MTHTAQATQTEEIQRRLAYMVEWWYAGHSVAAIRKKIAAGAEPSRADLLERNYRPDCVTRRIEQVERMIASYETCLVEDQVREEMRVALRKCPAIDDAWHQQRRYPIALDETMRDDLFKAIVEMTAEKRGLSEWLPMQERWRHIFDHDDAYDPKQKVAGVTRKAFEDLLRRVEALERRLAK